MSGRTNNSLRISETSLRLRKQAPTRVWLGATVVLIVFLSANVTVPSVHAQTTTHKQAESSSTHTIGLRALGLLREPPMPKSCQNQSSAPLNMLVLGDSILWGQGLKEENKISYIVQNWLCTATHRPVTVWREAHSGAVVDVEKSTDSATTNQPVEFNGEINAQRPTIVEQLSHADDHFKGREVHFVLMDGCINDFDFRNFINASMPLEQIDARTRTVCHDRMKPLLDDVAKHFPTARIVVTGYYPVITTESARNVFFRILFGWLFSTEKQKWFFPNSKKELFKKLTDTSRQWAESSDKWLRLSIEEANTTANNRIAFAPTDYKPQSPFGSIGSGFAAPKKTSLLWTSLFNSTGRGGLSKLLYVVFVLNFHPLRPNDEVSSDREKACKATDRSFGPMRECLLAAYGHPNNKGVKEYVETVTNALRRLLETKPLAN